MATKAIALADLKKGDTLILHMFTGIAVGVKEVVAADKKTVSIETRIGVAKFDRKTGKQVEPEAKSPKYANFITENDGSFVPKSEQKKAAKKEEKPIKKAEKKSDKAPEKKADVKDTKKKSKKSEDDDYEEVE